MHYWPIDGHTMDIIGDSDMHGGYNHHFEFDKNNISNGAIYFSNGWIQLPEGIYFDHEFTIMLLFKRTKNNNDDSRIFEFRRTKDTDADKFYFGLEKYAENTYRPYFCIYTDSNRFESIKYDKALSIDVWYHLTVVLNETGIALFLDGHPSKYSSSNLKLLNVWHTENYFGSGFPNSLPELDGLLDEIKFFKKALNPKQIEIEYKSKNSFLI
jgi:hypothetical protein